MLKREIGALEVVTGFTAAALFWSANFTIGLMPSHLLGLVDQTSLFNPKAYLYFGYALVFMLLGFMALGAIRGRKSLAYTESALAGASIVYLIILAGFDIEIPHWQVLAMLVMGIAFFTYAERHEFDTGMFVRGKIAFCCFLAILIPYAAGAVVAERLERQETSWKIYVSGDEFIGCGNVLVSTDDKTILYSTDRKQYELYPKDSFRISGECGKSEAKGQGRFS